MMIPAIALAFFAGGMMGVFFFAGLWWTVQNGVVSENPALWFLTSLLLRTVHSGWILFLRFARSLSRLVACLLDSCSRVIVVKRLTHAGRRADSIEETTLRLSDELVFWRYVFRAQ